MKKQLTPQQAVKRLKIIMLAIGLMIIIIIFMRLTNRKPYERQLPPAEETMNVQLDSIMKTDFPEGTILREVSPIEHISIDSDLKRQKEILNHRILMQEGKIDADSSYVKKIKKEMEKIQKRIDKEEKEYGYFRYVKYTEPDGKNYSAYQYMRDNMSYSTLILKYDYEEMEKLLNKKTYKSEEYENDNLLQ